MTISEMKDAIGALPRRKDGQVMAIPRELRGEISQLAKVEGKEVVGERLGISPFTIYCWGRKRKRAVPRRFHPVEVVPEVRGPSFVVEGPGGLRFVGMKLSEVAQLVREVSHEF